MESQSSQFTKHRRFISNQDFYSIFFRFRKCQTVLLTIGQRHLEYNANTDNLNEGLMMYCTMSLFIGHGKEAF